MSCETKEQIIETALELFSQNGFLGTSMSDIASQLKITKGALYKHYESKQQILEQIIERMAKLDLERAKKYEIKAVCAVGMERTGTRTEQIREKTSVPVAIPLFTLQGNFDVKKLRGIYRLMMNLMVKMVIKKLGAKTDRTQQENEMLEIMLHDGEKVCAENLGEVINWYKKVQ